MTQSTQHGIAYRADIDGLRAIAVAIVVIYHARLGVVPGGFVGVDVFFVISGYLITSIVANEARQGTFSIAGFYDRRIRRIFPALLVVIVATLVAGAIVMAPLDYQSVGRSAVAALTFGSNFWFAGKAGYFAPRSETMPLLHTWSLSVEEQFYLAAPLVIAFAARRGGRILPFAFWALLAVTIALSAREVGRDPTRAFYLPHTRAYELLIGVGLGLGLVPAVKSRVIREALSLAGLAAIAWAALKYSNETWFPGYAALLPCVGAALVIHSAAGQDGPTGVGRLLALPPMVGLGLISYSLYLWHWPILAFAEYEWRLDLTTWHRLALIGLAVLLSALTYRWIEQPARRSRIVLTRPRVFAAGLGAAAVLAIVSVGIDRSGGLPQRLAPDVAAFAKRAGTAIAGTRRACRPAKLAGGRAGCAAGVATSEPTFLLWGDSHAGMLMADLDATALKLGISGIMVTRGGCPPLFGTSPARAASRRKCATHPANAQAVLKNPSLRHVVLAARWASIAIGAHARQDDGDNGDAIGWSEVERRLKDTIKQLRDRGLKITVIGPVPELSLDLTPAVVKARMRGKAFDFDYDFAEFRRRQAPMLTMLEKIEADGVTVIYPHKIFCPGDVCSLLDNGYPMYRDDNHLNKLGVGKLSPAIERALVAGIR